MVQIFLVPLNRTGNKLDYEFKDKCPSKFRALSD